MQQFKVGDWLIGKHSKYPICIETIGTTLTNSSVTINGTFSVDQFTLWQPQKGEWCWIGKNLSKIVTHDRDGYFTCLNSNGIYTAYMELEYIYKIAEPFIGELPTFLQH